MKDERQANLIGVKPCGCITAFLVTHNATKTELRQFYRDMADTGREVRHADASVMDPKNPAWMPLKCPHGPDLSG